MKTIIITGCAFVCCGIIMFTIVIRSCMMERKRHVSGAKATDKELGNNENSISDEEAGGKKEDYSLSVSGSMSSNETNESEDSSE